MLLAGKRDSQAMRLETIGTYMQLRQYTLLPIPDGLESGILLDRQWSSAQTLTVKVKPPHGLKRPVRLGEGWGGKHLVERREQRNHRGPSGASTVSTGPALSYHDTRRQWPPRGTCMAKPPRVVGVECLHLS